VVTYALDTKNTAALKIARAFQAELALRQGRLAEASHWAGNFVAKPFAAMYRFYVPQFTLVSVLLAQDTTDSREQAADLLKQLYDFVVYIHNTRFQIDVLALQALLCDTRGEGPAALESLTHAVELAEPGGFIRLFVDIGPQMADLLKRLQKQNVAVGYIERILAAFRKNGHRTVPNATDHESPPPHLPVPQSPPLPLSQSSNALLIPPSLRGVGPNGPYGFRLVERAYSSERPEAAFPIPPSTTPPVPQPLVEPLTNRELDVMDLLAQRLSNKEIAAKLFISATTVKGHLQNIYEKLNVSKRREAVEKALMLGIVKR
jgi:LuxR family maltose regulon positive regulatory protein